LGNVHCDECQGTIPYPERYLAVDEKDSVEDDTGDTVHYCVDCAIKKGYARYKQEKGERILTFFPE
ncbi:hypothetical protein ACFLXT_05160, partial [Chloroflexota bacterium]